MERIFKTKKRKLEVKCLLSYSPDTDKEILRVSLLQTILPFLTNQATEFCSCGIANFIFSVNFTWLSLRSIVEDFWQSIGSEHNSISLHLCKLRRHVFFISRLQKIFLMVRFFNWISCNKGLKAKFSCFFVVFFFIYLTPLIRKFSKIRKTVFFLTSHRLKKYKKLHPRGFTNGVKMW